MDGFHFLQQQNNRCWRKKFRFLCGITLNKKMYYYTI